MKNKILIEAVAGFQRFMKKLEERRKDRKLGFEDLPEIGVAKATYTRYKRGQNINSLLNLFKLAEALGCEIRLIPKSTPIENYEEETNTSNSGTGEGGGWRKGDWVGDRREFLRRTRYFSNNRIGMERVAAKVRRKSTNPEEKEMAPSEDTPGDGL